MKHLSLLLLLVAGLQTISLAQTNQIKGRVTDDSTGAALSDVSVTLPGKTGGTKTNDRGEFTLNIPANSPGKLTLTISLLGYSSQTVTAEPGKNISISLSRTATALEDVVVIGYGTVRRRNLTGSVSSVNSKQLRDVPLSSAAEALTGRLAGVQVTTTEGAPGADVLIRIRGGGSITQDNAPIYIVDGIQVENALSFISPQDIASVDVLKDAATTAIYGARGANGVVIITTKSGKAGKTQVSYNGSFGWREIAKKMDVLNPYDFVMWQWERNKLIPDTSFSRNYGSTWDTMNVYKNSPFINWQEEVFGRKAGYQNHNVSVSGGSQATTFNLSLTSNKEDGIQLETGFDRKIANFKLDHKASDKFKIGFTARYLDQQIQGAGTTNTGTRTTNRLRHSIQYRPYESANAPSVDEFDDELYRNSGNMVNPVLLTQAEYRRQYTRAVNLSGYVSYSILKNLVFRSTIGFDNNNQRTDLFYGKITNTARNNSSLPVASIAQQNSTTFNISNTLQYSLPKFGDHSLDVMVAQEIYETKAKTNTTETRYFPADISPDKALANMGLGSPPPGFQQPRPTSNETPPSRIFSVFGRVNYDWNNKLIAQFTLRADRSSKFKYDNGLLIFPSGSVAYRLIEEKWLSDIAWLSDAKIRAGYGVAGNNRIGDLLYMQLYGVTGEYALGHTVLPGFAPPALANTELKWEKTVSRSVGLDLGFLSNRLQFTVDYYHNKGNDLLLSVAIPPTLGYTSQLQNVGSTSNRGWEFQLNGTPVQRKDFSWTSNFNIAFNKNRVESLGGLKQQTRSAGWQGSDGADDYLVKVGEPVGLMYGFVSDGIFQVSDFDYNAGTGAYTLKAGVANPNAITGLVRPGTMRIKDINGDGRITNDSDRVVLGNANPKFTGGWNNQFQYKNFDLSVFVNFVYGNDVYNANKIEWTDASFPHLNMLSVMKDRWRNIDDNGNLVTDPAELTKLNPNPKMWTPNNGQRYFLTSYAIEDGSFLRLNNITLGYTLPKKISTKARISNLRVYGTVNNLHTWTNYSGYDPEVTARRTDPLTPGVDFAAYPRAVTWVFGLNVTF
ncbi:SusC/RagA family TonB-linked outer membrane protein [Pseudobacter ginsenosidimutans]|uniref:TonB-linked SusC/RagA family outer membrane protein n=1 Tax=Pseudobacter ginsenosidimutans TaxID=661488 RepID=A0A4Q7MZP5_9BACT|nr:TonB-dependent receptor [Pseudobacter ginsenosidimutans]QEC43389.1 TonB-dependent receptor [Pseudobacter ginsenosidimutans]RZS74757.1 TonB-linked SusC/RagA family outer membrane protein [Pseudobacter ginsenosidimutans]